MEVEIRPATQVDAKGVAEVYLDSRKNFGAFAPLMHSDDEVRSWVSETLMPSGKVFVAESGSAIVGMMVLSRADGVSWIDHLYLGTGSVGQGIGSQMVELAKNLLKDPIQLYTFQENSGARRFYERHGFRPILWGDGEGNEERCPDILFEYRRE